jgi:hypothetical protein
LCVLYQLYPDRYIALIQPHDPAKASTFTTVKLA